MLFKVGLLCSKSTHTNVGNDMWGGVHGGEWVGVTRIDRGGGGGGDGVGVYEDTRSSLPTPRVCYTNVFYICCLCFLKHVEVAIIVSLRCEPTPVSLYRL